jgi:hypothetical protein
MGELEVAILKKSYLNILENLLSITEGLNEP